MTAGCLLIHSFFEVYLVIVDVEVVEEPKDREGPQPEEVESEEDGEEVEDPGQKEPRVKGEGGC